MLDRNDCRCNACNKIIILRVVVGLAAEQKMAFECPHCKATLRCAMHLDYENVRKELRSEDFEKLKDLADENAWPGVTIATDLPIHINCYGKGMDKGGSPFMSLHEFFGKDRFLSFNASYSILQRHRLGIFPNLRRISESYLSGDMNSFEKLLNQIPLPNSVKKNIKKDPRLTFFRLLNLIYFPLDAEREIDSLSKEIEDVLIGAKRDLVKYEAFCRDVFEKMPFPMFHSQVIGAITSAFAKFDALVPAMAYERFTEPEKNAVSDFRLHRDDYTELKSLYVDIFELCSRALVIMGGLMNLAARNDAAQWINGETYDVRDALRLTAANREFIVTESSMLNSLYEKLNRGIRNDFSHQKVDFKSSTGEIEYSDGARLHCLLFLNDFKSAFKVTGVLFYLCYLFRKNLPTGVP